jgi:hypothetical protein
MLTPNPSGTTGWGRPDVDPGDADAAIVAIKAMGIVISVIIVVKRRRIVKASWMMPMSLIKVCHVSSKVSI